jgi:prepilin-type N-terminal cleavage/methylation domain-containing protein
METPGRGYTLVELVVVMALLGVLLAIALPPTLRWRDAAAVRSARDELAAALAWTRVAAASHGGATLVLEPGTGRFWTRTGGRDGEAVDLAGRYGVRVDPGTEATVAFHYDALGIGRLTNRTVRIRRGAAEGGVTVSAYGRYRRW